MVLHYGPVPGFVNSELVTTPTVRNMENFLILRLFKTYSDIIPMDWKKAIVVPIHKGGDLSVVKKYRPVS